MKKNTVTQRGVRNGPDTGKRVIHAGLMILFMLMTQLLATALLSIIKLGRDPGLESAVNAALAEGDQGPFSEVLGSCTIAGTLIGGLVALLPYIIRDVSKKDYCAAWISPWLIPALISAGVVLNAATSALISMLPDQGGEATAGMIAGSDPLIALLSVGIVTPVVEEMFFRRAIINSLRDRNGAVAAVASAAVFAALHSGTVQMAYAFAFGLLFAAIYARSGNLAYSALLHIAVNTSSTLAVLAGEDAEKYAVPVVAVCLLVVIASGVVIFIRTRRRA